MARSRRLTHHGIEALGRAIRPKGRESRMVSVQAGRSFALALFAALVVAAPSQAAFPGTNGKIAYTRCGSVECAIWTMNSDGTNEARLTPTGERDETPAFSADGRRLV